MLYVSDYDIFVEPVRSVLIILQLMLSIGAIILSFASLFYIKKYNPKSKRSYLFGLPLFFFLFGIMRGIFVYHDFYALDILGRPLYILANTLLSLAFISLNNTIESNIFTRSKHIFTILGIALLIIFIITAIPGFIIARYLVNIIIITQVIPSLAIYLNVSLKGTGQARNKAVLIVVGIILLFTSSMLGLINLVKLLDPITTTILAPPISLIGLIFIGYGLLYSNLN